MMCRHVPGALRYLPDFVQRHVLDFEARIEDAAREFASTVPAGGRVLDAGAGESQYASLFAGLHYVAVDLGVGDPTWSYRRLDAVADLQSLPFADQSFSACVNIVTLEHVADPGQVIQELGRVLRPGGRLLLVTPLEWEEHQQPYDFFRYTRYGIEYLLRRAGMQTERIEPAGGYFRLLARRLLVLHQFFPGWLAPFVLLIAAFPGVLLPLLDGLDRKQAFTLGHICIARKL